MVIGKEMKRDFTSLSPFLLLRAWHAPLPKIKGAIVFLILHMLQLDPSGIQQINCQQNQSSTFFEQARTNEHMDIWTYGHSQTGPPFQDLTSGWIQPESDKNSFALICSLLLHPPFSCSLAFLFLLLPPTPFCIFLHTAHN